MEGLAINPLDFILVEKESVQDPQAPEGVLAKTPQPIAVQEEMTQVQQVDEEVVLKELQLVVLWGEKDTTIENLPPLSSFGQSLMEI